MSIRVTSADTLFGWLNEQAIRYVLLRDRERGPSASPRPRPGDDLDLLVDDAAIARIEARFPARRVRRGVKCDLYGVHGKFGSAYLGHPHLPPVLGERILARRRLREGRVFVPRAEDELLGLLYHIVYHKNLQSGIHWCDPAPAAQSPYRPALERLLGELNLSLPLTHERFHAFLVEHGHGIEHEPLVAYTQHDFRHGRKAFFHARLHDAYPGEMNLYVIRRIAVQMGRQDDLLRFLRERFRVLKTKEIPLLARMRARARMRGGKWRRGGPPHIAVVVFDASPTPTTEEDRATHPFVFNRNQFIKQAWREWFAANTAARDADNPVHSTDNEAEAIGHLPLFFTAEEQARMLACVRAMRGLAAHQCGPRGERR